MDHPEGAAKDGTRNPIARLASSLVVLGSLLLITAVYWRNWHVGLLVWGLAVAAAAELYPFGMEKLALRMVPDASVPAKARPRSYQRWNAFELGIVCVGVAVLASGTGRVAIVAGWTAFLVVIAGASTLGGVYVARRATTGTSSR